jgi:4-diphosphocytidyl-2-C-methyl-D-erythritol kinase
MSGSGSACFGLFADPAEARSAASVLASVRRDWWVIAGSAH